MKNKGEMLIESLVSIFIISITLMALIKGIDINYRSLGSINNIVEYKLNLKNINEAIKTLNYNKISKNEGEYISDIFGYVNKFRFNKDFFYKNNTKFSLGIYKTNMYIENKDKKIYLYKIKVGDNIDYWIPK